MGIINIGCSLRLTNLKLPDDGNPLMTKMPDKKVIVEIGADGGSITLFGVNSPRGWLYSRSVGDWTPELIDEERIQHDSNVVDSWEAALGLLDQYPWHRLSPQRVHPEFRRQVLAAVQKRFESSDDPMGRMEDWCEVCELFLPGVPEAHVLKRLSEAGGNEVASGKLESPISSAALAVNTFGWFVDRPELLPAFPSLASIFPATFVDVEYCARFPWAGGRHPWLDAIIETDRHLIGVESQRFEPYYQGSMPVSFSEKFDDYEWDRRMGPFESMRDDLRVGNESFQYLDAAQLVKHAFGLVTDGRRKAKLPILVYLFAEPSSLKGRRLGEKKLTDHRAEITRFANAVQGAAVSFYALSYRDWLQTWPSAGPVAEHAAMLAKRFQP